MPHKSCSSGRDLECLCGIHSLKVPLGTSATVQSPSKVTIVIKLLTKTELFVVTHSHCDATYDTSIVGVDLHHLPKKWSIDQEKWSIDQV